MIEDRRGSTLLVGCIADVDIIIISTIFQSYGVICMTHLSKATTNDRGFKRRDSRRRREELPRFSINLAFRLLKVLKVLQMPRRSRFKPFSPLYQRLSLRIELELSRIGKSGEDERRRGGEAESGDSQTVGQRRACPHVNGKDQSKQANRQVVRMKNGTG